MQSRFSMMRPDAQPVPVVRREQMTGRNGHLLTAMELDPGGIATVFDGETGEEVDHAIDFEAAVEQMKALADQD
jgi:hypothetical protein